MSNEKPMTAWQECKAISEALEPTPEPPEQTEQRLRATCWHNWLLWVRRARRSLLASQPLTARFQSRQKTCQTN
jgi:hypothetical protein